MNQDKSLTQLKGKPNGRPSTSHSNFLSQMLVADSSAEGITYSNSRLNNQQQFFQNGDQKMLSINSIELQRFKNPSVYGTAVTGQIHPRTIRQGIQTAPITSKRYQIQNQRINTDQSLGISQTSPIRQSSPPPFDQTIQGSIRFKNPSMVSSQSLNKLSFNPFLQLSQNNSSMKRLNSAPRTTFTSHRMFRPQGFALLAKQWEDGGMMKRVATNNDNSNYYYLIDKSKDFKRAKNDWVNGLGGCLLFQTVRLNDNAQLKSKNQLKPNNRIIINGLKNSLSSAIFNRNKMKQQSTAAKTVVTNSSSKTLPTEVSQKSFFPTSTNTMQALHNEAQQQLMNSPLQITKIETQS